MNYVQGLWFELESGAWNLSTRSSLLLTAVMLVYGLHFYEGLEFSIWTKVDGSVWRLQWGWKL